MKNKAALCLAAITLVAFAACADPLQGDLGLYCQRITSCLEPLTTAPPWK